MIRYLAVLVLLLLAVGCSSKSSTSRETAASGSATRTTAGPHLITLTNQTQAWVCPTCGMTYDGPGECEMKDGTLALMNIRYMCPTGGEALSSTGRCPTHGAEARVEKTPAAAPDSTG
jgi:predicted RNA-binding Zn-ribbon protein involved in translation (DUF1610 family)